MLSRIEIGYIRSFGTTQSLSFAMPNGNKGSGYNIIVGKNNSGKSTVIKLIRDIIANQDTITVSQEARHDPNAPHATVDWIQNGKTDRTSIDNQRTGGHFRKVGGDFRNAAGYLSYIPSRRPFASEFQSTHQLNPFDYEQSDYLNRRMNQAYFDNILGAAIATLLNDAAYGQRLLTLLSQIDPRMTGLDSDNLGGKDVIRFQSASGRWHIISDSGDGTINLIRILHAIAATNDEQCIIIDEPELSLHPQLQRRLYDTLFELSANRQILIVSHSPHFISWQDISNEGRLFRLYLDSHGYSQVRASSRECLAAIRRVAYDNVTNRKYFDVFCKELFFSDEALLVEGPDDVHYISNYLDAQKLAPLPFMGYGCGGAGNIRLWLHLCKELGIRAAALYDSDKREEFRKSELEFQQDQNQIKNFLLPTPDIRDKHDRDALGHETARVRVKGIFKRNGAIHEETRETFNGLLHNIRTFLQ